MDVVFPFGGPHIIAIPQAYKGRSKPDSLFYIPPPPQQLIIPAILSLPPEAAQESGNGDDSADAATAALSPASTSSSSAPAFRINMRPNDEEDDASDSSDNADDDQDDGDGLLDGSDDGVAPGHVANSLEDGFYLIPEKKPRSSGDPPDSFGREESDDALEEHQLVWNSDPYVIMSNRMKNVLIESGLLDDTPPVVESVEMTPLNANHHREGTLCFLPRARPKSDVLTHA
jgi:hypothetical protein